MASKIGQLTLASTGFFWCFLLWFATAAFSPTIVDKYGLSLVEIGVLASSALWLAPIGRIIAGSYQIKLVHATLLRSFCCIPVSLVFFQLM